MKKKIVLLAALLFLTAGCQKNDDIPQSVPSEDVPSTDIVAYGEVLYRNESQICIDFPAQIESIDVEVGDCVKAGDTLITLSTDVYRNNILDLQARVDFAKASAGNVEFAASQEQISVLKNQLAYKTEELADGNCPELQLLQNVLNLAQKEEKQAREDLDKYKALLDSGAISQAEYQTFSDALDRKSKAVQDAELNIVKTKRTLQETIDALTVSLKNAQVLQNQQKASTAMAQANLDLMLSKTDKPYISGNNIVSDLAYGIVARINIQKGTILNGQTVQHVMTLIDADSIYVNAQVPEEFIGEIFADSKVYIVPTADKDAKIPGHILLIPGLAVEDDGDHVLNVQVKPDENSPYLKPGFTADVYFSAESEAP